MAVAEPELPEEPAEPAEPEVSVAAEPDLPIHAPPVREPLSEPERVIGDTPLSAIERLAILQDPSPRTLRRDRILAAAWAASFAILAGVGVAGYTERNVLMKQWPASKRVYATLGLAPLEGKAGDGKVGDVKPGNVNPGNGTDGVAKGEETKTGDAKGTSGQGTAETPAR